MLKCLGKKYFMKKIDEYTYIKEHKMYSRFETQQIPSGITVLKPEELDRIWYRPMDLSQYNKIHVFGDIHGCYTALKEYMDSNGNIKEDEFYIFCGDYIDRGIENAETINYLCELSKLPNVIFLEGNHERWLWMWANNLISRSKEFEFVTVMGFLFFFHRPLERGGVGEE